jgi:hypothetical protein
LLNLAKCQSEHIEYQGTYIERKKYEYPQKSTNIHLSRQIFRHSIEGQEETG